MHLCFFLNHLCFIYLFVQALDFKGTKTEISTFNILLPLDYSYCNTNIS